MNGLDLTPFQQRIVICALAVLLLAVSVVGLWLCRRLHRAYDHLYRRQREESEVLLAHPDYRQSQALHPRVPSPGLPPEMESVPDLRSRLDRLERLHAAGALTDEEFAARQAELEHKP